MTIAKLTLALSVATLLGAASPVLADETPSVSSPDDSVSVTGTAYGPAPALGYAQQPTYGYVPSPILNGQDVIPPRTVPLGEVPPTEFETVDH